MQPFDIGSAPVIKATAVCKSHHLLMCTCQKYTDGTGLVLADFSSKPGTLDTMLNRLGAVVNTVRESDKFTIEVCSALVSVVGNVRFTPAVLRSMWNVTCLDSPASFAHAFIKSFRYCLLRKGRTERQEFVRLHSISLLG